MKNENGIEIIEHNSYYEPIINEIIIADGKKLKCVDFLVFNAEVCCLNCELDNSDSCMKLMCNSASRKDGKEVMFICVD